MGNEPPQSADDLVFDLRFKSKSLERESRRSEKAMNKEKRKVVAALKRGQADVARVFAENAIRKKSEMNNYLRLSARLDATAGRIQAAARQKNLTRQLSRVTKGLDLTMANMDVDKVTRVMDRFEQNCEQMDVLSATQMGAMQRSTAHLESEDEVDAMLKQVGNEYTVDVTVALSDVPTTALPTRQPVQTEAVDAEADALDRRLAALRM